MAFPSASCLCTLFCPVLDTWITTSREVDWKKNLTLLIVYALVEFQNPSAEERETLSKRPAITETINKKEDSTLSLERENAALKKSLKTSEREYLLINNP